MFAVQALRENYYGENVINVRDELVEIKRNWMARIIKHLFSKENFFFVQALLVWNISNPE